MRVEKIEVLLVIIQLQIFMCSASSIPTTVVDELKSNNSLALKMIRKLTQESNVAKVLENLDVNVERVLETLEKIPDIMFAPLAVTIKSECLKYLENTSKYCQCKPRSHELKGGQCSDWRCTRELKLKVAVCEIDPMISFCKMIPDLPFPEHICKASDFMQRVLTSNLINEGFETIFPYFDDFSYKASRESSWLDYALRTTLFFVVGACLVLVTWMVSSEIHSHRVRRKKEEKLDRLKRTRRQVGRIESKKDLDKEDINPKLLNVKCKNQNEQKD